MDNNVASELLKMDDNFNVPVSLFALKFLHNITIWHMRWSTGIGEEGAIQWG